MFYRKALLASRSKTLRKNISLDISDAYLDCDNVRNTPNGLSYIGHFDIIYCTHNVKKVAYLYGDDLHLLCDDGLYNLSNGMETKLFDALPDVCFVNSGSYVYFSQRKNGVYMRDNGSSTKRVHLVGQDKMIFSNSRIFGLNSRKLMVVPVDPQEDWSNVYYVDLPEECSDLVALGNKVYALGNTCYVYECKDFAIDSKCYPTARNLGKVQSGSAVAFGSKAMFATSGGLYMLGNDKVEEVFRDITSAHCLEGAVACAFDGNYLISCKRSENSESNDITLLLDAESGKLRGVFGCGFETLSSFGKEVYGTREGIAYRFFNEDTPSVFKRQNVDMGVQKTKYLDWLIVRTDCLLDVRITCGLFTRLYSFNAVSGKQRVRICGMGEEFAVELRSKSKMNVQSVEIVAHVQQED